ncbi:MAG TPA: Gfo/Idh/MocA family oxidoreductase [Opitutaceae bacterium]|jgi:predicted dehydrogenase
MTPLLRAIHVGVGNRGQWPLKLATTAAGFQAVALVDSDPKMLAAAAASAAVPTYTDLTEALAKTAADVAIICSPTRFHVEQGSQCLAAGLHVLVEKGMAPTLADAKRLVTGAQLAGRGLCVAQNYRYQSMERTVGRMLVDAQHPQYAGPPFLIEYTQNRQRPHPRTLDYPFASVWDMSCHHFDTLLSWLGPGFIEVTARAFGPAWARYTYPNNTSLQIVHASGCFVHYLHTHNAAFNEVHVRVQAERGTILVDGQNVSFCPRADTQLQNAPIVPVTAEPSAGEAGVLEDFYRHCVRGESVGISGASNLSVMSLCDATCRSSELGVTVSLE